MCHCELILYYQAMKGIHNFFVIPITFVVTTTLICFMYVSIPDYHHPAGNICNGTSCEEVNSPYYLVHTPTCAIPDIDPLHKSLKKFIAKNPQPLVCSEKQPLTEESGRTLTVYQERGPLYGVAVGSLNCSYEGIARKEQRPGNYTKHCDSRWRIKDKVMITQRETTIHEDAIFVECVDINYKEKYKPVYKSVHFFIQPRRIRKKMKKFKAVFGERSREKLSVIIMGTDSVSRGNLRRHMPKTFDYLTNHLKVIDLQGLTKIGDNTDPNMSAVLTGMHYDELKNHSCVKDRKIKTIFDNCPFIWKDFEAKGYATALGEDSPWMGTFHWNKVGFCKEPTDYYNRPYFYASEKLIGRTDNKTGHFNMCQGFRASISLVHNYSLAIAESLKDIPYFGFYWSSSTTHDYLKAAAKVDQHCLDYLKLLSEGGYLDHTVLVFISDHGLRWGDFRTTYSGMLEERLPYVMMKFPEWFERKYPEVMGNLRMNRRRLTSFFDLHVTLHDILNEAYIDPGARAYSPELPYHGQSLFEEVPLNRTCEEAGIPDHYCACETTKEVDPLDPILHDAAKFAVAEINKGLLRFPECAHLGLDKVIQGRIGYASRSTMPKRLKTVRATYIVTFATLPGNAKMEATLRYHDGNFKLTSEVSRINLYGEQSHCITDQIYRKYCYCRDLLVM